MLKISPLRFVYQNQNFKTDDTPFRIAVRDFLYDRAVDIADLEYPAPRPLFLSEQEKIFYAENILSVLLLARLVDPAHPPLPGLLSASALHSFNPQSRFQTVFAALLRHLTGLPMQELSLNIPEGSGCPIDLEEHSPRQAQPYAPYHAEFGVLLSLLARLTENKELQTSVLSLAKWHLNTLDSCFRPLVGLFSREKAGSLYLQSMWNYLFFYSLTDLFGESEYSGIVAHYAHFLETYPIGTVAISPLLPLLEETIFRLSRKGAQTAFVLPEIIYEPSSALVGIRNSHKTVVCTLHGGYTGLGCVRSRDVQILSYGPQHLPLEECLGFGIEGNRLSDHGVRRSSIVLTSDGFSLKGCVRLVDRPPDSSGSLFRFGKLSGVWFETEQELRSGHFNLTTGFLGFDGWDSVAFSFFIKARRCRIDSLYFHPGTLDRYEGTVQELLLEGEEGAIRISSSDEGTMQVVPLAGGSNFWGADFLIAYMLRSDRRCYNWAIDLY